jgi:hypothetical protein
VLPQISGRPVRVELRRSLGPHLASTSIPRRVILLDAEVLQNRGDFERILIHEIFHFAWRRLSNATRRSWEGLLASEFVRKDSGELGWSAELRKSKLKLRDRYNRTPAWRRYACESFCDTAAWLFSGIRDHEEFTLLLRYRRRRGGWFARNLPATIPIPI